MDLSELSTIENEEGLFEKIISLNEDIALLEKKKHVYKVLYFIGKTRDLMQSSPSEIAQVEMTLLYETCMFTLLDKEGRDMCNSVQRDLFNTWLEIGDMKREHLGECFGGEKLVVFPWHTDSLLDIRNLLLNEELRRLVDHALLNNQLKVSDKKISRAKL